MSKAWQGFLPNVAQTVTATVIATAIVASFSYFVFSPANEPDLSIDRYSLEVSPYSSEAFTSNVGSVNETGMTIQTAEISNYGNEIYNDVEVDPTGFNLVIVENQRSASVLTTKKSFRLIPGQTIKAVGVSPWLYDRQILVSVDGKAIAGQNLSLASRDMYFLQFRLMLAYPFLAFIISTIGLASIATFVVSSILAITAIAAGAKYRAKHTSDQQFVQLLELYEALTVHFPERANKVRAMFQQRKLDSRKAA
jgi:hypothetical protein